MGCTKVRTTWEGEDPTAASNPTNKQSNLSGGGKGRGKGRVPDPHPFNKLMNKKSGSAPFKDYNPNCPTPLSQSSLLFSSLSSPFSLSLTPSSSLELSRAPSSAPAMIPHRRRDFAAGNHFSFSHPPRSAAAATGAGADAMGEYDAWAERIKGANHGYFARSPDPNPGAWAARRPDQIRRAAEEQEFRWEAKERYDSDTPSPPLWKSSPIARSAGSSPLRSVYDDEGDNDGDRGGRNPNQRAQAIARYRQEMMEMVRGLPEAAYELSLRDIVESPSPRIARIEGQRPIDEAESPKEKSEKGANRSEKETTKEKKKKKLRRISRSESLDTGGLLIRMFMPLSVGGRRKSFRASSPGTGAKVSPKPTAAAAAAAAAAAEEGNNKGEEWWNKNEFSEPESSRTSSTNSSSSSGSSKSGSRSRSRRMSSCYSFFRSNKNRSRRS